MGILALGTIWQKENNQSPGLKCREYQLSIHTIEFSTPEPTAKIPNTALPR